jgi:tRNA A-37 threonylcarbamoyl transferase component Bud32
MVVRKLSKLAIARSKRVRNVEFGWTERIPPPPPAPAAGGALEYLRSLRPSTVSELGRGANGAAFLADMTRNAMQELRRRLGAFRMGSFRTGKMVVKVTTFDPREDTWDEWVRRARHEAAVQAHLSSIGCMRVPCSLVDGGRGTTVCPAKLVPRVYAAGIDAQRGVFVLAMESLAGMTTLKKYAGYDASKRGRVSALLFAAVEKAMVTLWLSGVAHGDPHHDNLFVVPPRAPGQAPQVRFIDFGMSVVVPAAFTARMREELERAPRGKLSLADAVWAAKNGMQNYVNAVIAKRGFRDWYNSDGELLRSMYDDVRDPAAVPAARLRVWGCAAGRGQAS